MPDPTPLLDRDPPNIAGFNLLGRLGAGGQGTVYLAERDQDGARVAIKCLSHEALGESGVRQRFVREAEAARQVASFCTAAVLAADFEADTPYIVSEYVEGLSLHQRVRQGGVIVGGDLIRLAVATATALVAIHEAGIVHRDFKPGNVLLGEGGARVIDFGIAQITEGTGTLTNSTVGAPSFMAPEQITDGSATFASDVFAWGAVLVFAATGASPFDGSTVPNVLHNVLNAEPDLSAIPEPLRPLTAAALSKDPAARPGAVDLLMALLGRQERPTDASSLDQAVQEAHSAVIDGASAATATVPWSTPNTNPRPSHAGPTPPRRPPRWLLPVGAVAAVGLLGAGVLLGHALGAGGTSGDGTEVGGEAGDSGNGAAGSDGHRFSEEEAGTWQGVADSGNLFTAEVETGERAAALRVPDDDSCSTEIRLLGVNDNEDGYDANVAFTGQGVANVHAYRCVDRESASLWTPSDEVELTFEGDTMTIHFYREGLEDAGEEPGPQKSEPQSTLVLTRTD
ncbi:serine/threonine-protein kinase [Spiractinospora alimapuensis]|uniref:serine/threonine-protein kinase n=1 Tax=Spiractinospora alimapuensis TaxID=2820884 RepID=UPI001F3150FC|nr:serine/threonine-protein kinase [Spiractinospora alimapuensis]